MCAPDRLPHSVWAAAEPHRSCDVSQSMKLTRTFCTLSDSALGVGTGAGAGGAVEDDAPPFMTSGGCGTSADPLAQQQHAALRIPVMCMFSTRPDLRGIVQDMLCDDDKGHLLGRAIRMAVSSRAAFSWVNQSVRCSSLQEATLPCMASATTTCRLTTVHTHGSRGPDLHGVTQSARGKHALCR